MSVYFTDSRSLPREFKAMGHYRQYGAFGQNMNTESAIADIFRSLTTGAVDFFGGSSSAAKQAQAEAALANAQLMGQQAYQEAETKRTLIYVGAGLVAVVVLASVFKSSVRIKNRVGGYRRKKRSRR